MRTRRRLQLPMLLRNRREFAGTFAGFFDPGFWVTYFPAVRLGASLI
jgi:hypothetical protein